MTIDKALIGTEYPPVTLHVDAGRLAFFARATGQADPVYSDIEAAKAAGLPGLPAPPTWCFSVALEHPDQWGFLDELGVDLGELLHGGQSFEYHLPIYSGDDLTVRRRITDIYDKKGGSLEFVHLQGLVTNQRDELVVTLDETLIVQHRGSQEAS